MKTPIDNTGAKRGRSLNPIPSVMRWCELVNKWRLARKEARQNKYKEPSFDQWMKKSGFEMDEEAQKAAKLAQKKSQENA